MMKYQDFMEIAIAIPTSYHGIIQVEKAFYFVAGAFLVWASKMYSSALYGIIIAGGGAAQEENAAY